VNECNQPYRICKKGKIKLNVQPPECVLIDVNYRKLYSELYYAILNYNLEVLLANMVKTATATNSIYNDFLIFLVGIFKITLGSESPRLLVSESDGTVIYDTSKPLSPGPGYPGNSYSNWQQKLGYSTGSALTGNPVYLINENHNSRVSINTSQLFQSGVGYETKYSSTVNTNQAYVAIRAGQYLNNTGTFRLSINI
jgi:hypothetical protein